MSPDQDRSAPPPDPHRDPPGDSTRDGEPGETPVEPHDETGLELARSIARSLARPGAARRRTTGRSGQPGVGGSGVRRGRGTDPQLSGAHPDERDPQLLDATIGRLIADQGWGTDVRVHGVFSRWDAIVGREVAQHCTPESFDRQGEATRGGRLVVRTDSTAWATQMRLLAPTVVRRLNEELGDGAVAVIDVQGPRGPSWKRGRRSVRGRGPRDTYG